MSSVYKELIKGGHLNNKNNYKKKKKNVCLKTRVLK